MIENFGQSTSLIGVYPFVLSKHFLDFQWYFTQSLLIIISLKNENLQANCIGYIGWLAQLQYQ